MGAFHVFLHRCISGLHRERKWMVWSIAPTVRLFRNGRVPLTPSMHLTVSHREQERDGQVKLLSDFSSLETAAFLADCRRQYQEHGWCHVPHFLPKQTAVSRLGTSTSIGHFPSRALVHVCPYLRRACVSGSNQPKLCGRAGAVWLVRWWLVPC
jgi:hypothetical protein